MKSFLIGLTIGFAVAVLVGPVPARADEIPLTPQECAELGAQAAKYSYYQNKGVSRDEVEKAVVKWHSENKQFNVPRYCNAALFAVQVAYEYPDADYVALGQDVMESCNQAVGRLSAKFDVCDDIVKGEF